MPFGTAQALPGSAPSGARTFLERFRARDRPADDIHLKSSMILWRLPGDVRSVRTVHADARMT